MLFCVVLMRPEGKYFVTNKLHFSMNRYKLLHISFTVYTHVQGELLLLLLLLLLTYLLTYLVIYLLTFLLTVIELSLGGSNSHTGIDKTNKNKYT
jgi:hypothetical protein